MKASRTRTRGKITEVHPVKHDTVESLPVDHLEWVEAWGMADRAMSYVYRPSTVKRVEEVIALARQTGRKVGLKGGGNSYGDAFLNEEGIVLDLTRLNRILEWDPDTGIIKAEPGVTLEDLWKYIVEDGWWPPVVSGTMFTTLGGCLGMNIHGKNAYQVGPFGNHVLDFELLLPSGRKVHVTRESDPELFHGAISGFGMLGIFTWIRLRMKKIHSGRMRIWAKKARNFYEMVELFEEHASSMDYMVGWADCLTRRKESIGRGEMHFARQLEPGEDKYPAQSLRVDRQMLPDTILGVIPKSILWRAMKPFVSNLGMRLINTAKYCSQWRPGAEKPYFQSHAEFHFLLDYVPNWKQSYRPGGLIQYQSFVPKDQAARIFTEQIRLSHQVGIHPYLGVTKKHIPDDFLMTHGLDGYSLALDYPVTRKNRRDLWKLCHGMDELVLNAGGRFYLAKDSTMRRGTVGRFLPEGHLERFQALKQRLDPEGILSTNMSRRVFGSPSAPVEGEKTLSRGQISTA